MTAIQTQSVKRFSGSGFGGYSKYDAFVQQSGVNPHVGRAYRLLSEHGALNKMSAANLSGVDYMSPKALQLALMQHYFPYSALKMPTVASVINTDKPLNDYEAKALLGLYQRGKVYNLLFEQGYLSVGTKTVVLESKDKQALKDKLSEVLADENEMKLLDKSAKEGQGTLAADALRNLRDSLNHSDAVIEDALNTALQIAGSSAAASVGKRVLPSDIKPTRSAVTNA